MVVIHDATNRIINGIVSFVTPVIICFWYHYQLTWLSWKNWPWKLCAHMRLCIRHAWVHFRFEFNCQGLLRSVYL